MQFSGVWLNCTKFAFIHLSLYKKRKFSRKCSYVKCKNGKRSTPPKMQFLVSEKSHS